MNIFNLDLHVAVISDLNKIYTELGHNVTSWNMSSHSWVIGKNSMENPIVNSYNWRFIDQSMCNKFYNQYKNVLSNFDVFVVTYPPVFAMLYEKFNKPIIIHVPIRYETPYSNNKQEWERFNIFLQRGVDSGQIILVANSEYDKKYTEYFLERECKRIPNLCEYTGVRYNPQNKNFLYYSHYKNYEEYLNGIKIPNLVEKTEVLPSGYKWEDLVKYKAIVGIPYHPSTMSIYEFYTQCMPLYFPTIDFITKLRVNHPGLVLRDSSWNQIFGLPSQSIIKPGPDDPNNYNDINVFKKWIPLCDWYDKEWMPHITYFDSFDELKSQLESVTDDELKNISNKMSETNIIRKQKIYNFWKGILNNL